MFELNQKIHQKDKPSAPKEKEKTIAFKSTEKEILNDEDGDHCFFFREKSDTFEAFKNLCLKLRVENDSNIGKIVRICSDHGKDLNIVYDDFANLVVYLINFQVPKLQNNTDLIKP